MGCNSTRKNENIQYVRSCCIRECSFSFPIQSSMRVFMLNWHIYVRPLVQFTRSMEGSDWIRIPLCVLVSNSYPVVQCSCLFRIPFICFRVQFVSLMCFIYVGSEDFVSISYPVVRFSCLFRILFTWLRVQFVLRLCFIFVGSGKIVSNSYPVVRWSWLFRTLFKRFRVQFVTACVFLMWGVKSWCQIRIQLCGVRVSFQILLMRRRVQSRILLLFHLMWGPEISCQVRIHSCGVFMFSSYPACVSFMWGLKSSWQSRIQSCAFVFISYYSPVFSRMFSSTVRIPLVFNSCVVREFILNSCRALFAYSFQIRFQS